MNEKINIQDVFLNAARKSATPVIIHIINGFTLKDAIVKSYDSYSLLVECDGRQMMIYKHAVSTITASQPIEIKNEKEN